MTKRFHVQIPPCQEILTASFSGFVSREAEEGSWKESGVTFKTVSERLCQTWVKYLFEIEFNIVLNKRFNVESQMLFYFRWEAGFGETSDIITLLGQHFLDGWTSSSYGYLTCSFELVSTRRERNEIQINPRRKEVKAQRLASQSICLGRRWNLNLVTKGGALGGEATRRVVYNL